MFAPPITNCEAVLFSTTPVTLVPITALTVAFPLLVPALVTVPVLLTVVVETVIPAAIELLLSSVRLPVPVVPPERVSSELPLLLLFVIVVPELLTVRAPLTVSAEAALFSVTPVMFEPTPALTNVRPLPVPALVTVPVLLTEVVETVMPLAMELLLSKVRLPVPVVPPVRVNNELPLLLLLIRVVPELLTVKAPLTVRAEVVLFSVIPVIFEPMPALINVSPLPVPEFVIVPVLLTDVPERVIPLAVELLLFSIKLPVPVAPPEAVSIFVPLLLVRVVPPLLMAMLPLTVSAEVVLFSVMPVTFEPTAALIVVVPVPAPVFVTVPTLLTLAVERAIVPVVAFSLMVRLFVPVTPPLKVPEMAVPVLPMVNVPVVPVANEIALA